jgi:hypothetical protein
MEVGVLSADVATGWRTAAPEAVGTVASGRGGLPPEDGTRPITADHLAWAHGWQTIA